MVRLGRDPACHLRVDHPSVAPRHARLERFPSGGVVLTAEAHGVAVDGQPLDPGERRRLSPGATLSLGPDIAFTLVEEPA